MALITLQELLNTPIVVYSGARQGVGEITLERKMHTPVIRCKDGFNMSVQTGESNYCTPRSNDGPWTTAEVGFPSECVEEFMPYVDDSDNPTETVYGYVPVEVIEQVIEAHGGICIELMALTSDEPLQLR